MVKWYKQLKLIHKFTIVAIFTLTVFAVSFVLLHNNFKKVLLTFKKNELKLLTELATRDVKYYFTKSLTGELSEENAKKSAFDIINKLRYGNYGYFFILDYNGKMLFHPIKEELIGKNLISLKDPDGVYFIKKMLKIVKNNRAGFVRYKWPKPGSKIPVDKISYVVDFPEWGWIIGTGMYIDDIIIIFNQVSNFIIITLIIASIIVFLQSFPVFTGFSKKLHHVIEIAKYYAKKDFSKQLDTSVMDDIGEMSAALKNMLNNVIGKDESIIKSFPFPYFTVNNDFIIESANEKFFKLTDYTQQESIKKLHCYDILNTEFCNTENCPIRMAKSGGINSDKKLRTTIYDKNKNEKHIILTAAVLKDLSGKEIGGIETLIDITQDVKIQSKVLESAKSLANISVKLNTSSNEFSKSMEELASSVTESSATAEEINRNIDSIRGNVEQEASAVTEVTASVGEMSDTINVIGENITDTRKVTEDMENYSEEIITTVMNANDKMKSIKESSDRISKIIEVITGIAEQTNLLALNAAIEAARAGEAGKGFAVVADEVKNLAEQSAKAAKDISQIIQDSNEKVISGQEGMQKVVTMAETTIKGIKNIATRIEEITSSVQQEVLGFNEINKNVNEFNNLTTEIANMIEEQSKSMNSFVEVIDNISNITEENSSASKEIKFVSESVANLATELEKLAENLIR